MDIQNQMPTFSKGQKRIASYLLDHYEKAAFMTAAKLGNTVNVSESTVVRFANQLGFDGYPKFQKTLQDMIKNKLTSLQRMEATSDNLAQGDMLSNVLNFDIDRIRQTLATTSREAFTGAVDDLVNARNIYIVGVRSAWALASFLGYYFNLTFDHVQLIDAGSASDVFEKVMLINKTDVMIGISFPRYAGATVQAMEFARDRGASVIAITDSESSPLSPYAHHLLLARSDMVSFIDSLVAPLSLINALIVETSIRKRDEVEKRFRELENIWEHYGVYKQSREKRS